MCLSPGSSPGHGELQADTLPAPEVLMEPWACVGPAQRRLHCDQEQGGRRSQVLMNSGCHTAEGCCPSASAQILLSTKLEGCAECEDPDLPFGRMDTDTHRCPLL